MQMDSSSPYRLPVQHTPLLLATQNMLNAWLDILPGMYRELYIHTRTVCRGGGERWTKHTGQGWRRRYCNKHSQTHQYNAPVLQTAACSSCNSHAIMRHPLLLSKRAVLMNLHEKQVLFSPGVPASARTLTCARVGVAVWYEYSPKLAGKLKVCGKPPSATTSH